MTVIDCYENVTLLVMLIDDVIDHDIIVFGVSMISGGIRQLHQDVLMFFVLGGRE